MLDSAGMASDSLNKIAQSAEGFYAQNIHITRDWRRNDFFDATAIYPATATDHKISSVSWATRSPLMPTQCTSGLGCDAKTRIRCR